MAKSSINLQIAKIVAFLHNVREALVTYTIADASRNEYDRNGKEAHEYYIMLLKEAFSNYTERTKQHVQTDEKKFIWEAVINLNEQHKLIELKDLARVLEEKYGWQPLQISIHRDEGHKDQESGENIYNYHAHIVFFMLDKQGIYRFKKRDFGIKKMEELQTLVANVLKMERGISKKETKRERLNHRQYRQVQQNKIKNLKILNSKHNDEMLKSKMWIQKYQFIEQEILRILNLNMEKYSFIDPSEVEDESPILELLKQDKNDFKVLEKENEELMNIAYKTVIKFNEIMEYNQVFSLSYKDLYEDLMEENYMLKMELEHELLPDSLDNEIEKSSKTKKQKQKSNKSTL